MSRATAQLNSLRMISKVRLAWIGAPRRHDLIEHGDDVATGDVLRPALTESRKRVLFEDQQILSPGTLLPLRVAFDIVGGEFGEGLGCTVGFLRGCGVRAFVLDCMLRGVGLLPRLGER